MGIRCSWYIHEKPISIYRFLFTYYLFWWFLALAHVHGSVEHWISFEKYDFTSKYLCVYIQWMGWLAQWRFAPSQFNHDTAVASGNRIDVRIQWQIFLFFPFSSIWKLFSSHIRFCWCRLEFEKVSVVRSESMLFGFQRHSTRYLI